MPEETVCRSRQNTKNQLKKQAKMTQYRYLS